MLISVNYHYIDDENKYERGIYPTSVERLENQLNELSKQYTFVSQKDLLDAISSGPSLPEKSCLITFDDGLKTQTQNAVPILEKFKVPAIFFINSLPHAHAQACQVHKIHYLLYKLEPKKFLEEVLGIYKQITGKKLDTEKIQQSSAQKENKYDTNETVVLKYILNSYLEPELARSIVNNIFSEHCDDEEKFCEALYLSKEDIQQIDKHDLFNIGLHTKSHINIPYEAKEVVMQDIVDNYTYLSDELGIKDIKCISYPIGKISVKDIADKIVSVSQDLGLVLGFTMGRKKNLHMDNPLFLDRYDTNDVVAGKKPII